MIHPFRTLLIAGTLAVSGVPASASTSYGDLNNFDTVNDTGQECHGFEIEIEGARSTDITHTYNWNHYGAPRISEDLTDPARPRVIVRYESAKNSDGSWAAYTAVPTAPLAPTNGHMCTNPSVNEGCEHFGLGYYGQPTAIRYHWLIDDGTGNLVQGPAVNVATPSWVYVPPVVRNPGLPPDPVENPVVEPAQVVAAIPAPEVEIEPGKKFGEPVWVKVIKTKTHNKGNVALEELISDDADDDGLADWQNGEPAEVESEWKLLQRNDGENDKIAEVQGAPDEVGDGDEVATRRYEFYAYAGDATTLDGENGEAMCSEVADDGVHGIGDSVEVTDAWGDSYTVDCTAQEVVGDYLGAQMAGFDAEAPLSLILDLQPGDPGTPYVPRSLVIGGNTPYEITVTGDMPEGLSLGGYDDPGSDQVLGGVLWGTPATAGVYEFDVEVTDADGTVASQAYTLAIGAPAAVPSYLLSAELAGTGSGTVFGSGIDCGVSCSVLLDEGTAVSLEAIPAGGSAFMGWQNACAGTGVCEFDLAADSSVTAVFDAQQYALAVTLAGDGKGTITGGGINCGRVCSNTLAAGSEVTLTATPKNKAMVFMGWDGPCTGREPTCTVSMDATTSVTATFLQAALNKFSVTVDNAGPSAIVSKPGGVSCGKKCVGNFKVGTTVTLIAKPKRRQTFVGWTGDCSGSGTQCTFTVFENRSVGAIFE